MGVLKHNARFGPGIGGRVRPTGVALLCGAVALFPTGAGHAQEDTAAVSFSVVDDGRARIEVPSAGDLYHVLSTVPIPTTPPPNTPSPSTWAPPAASFSPSRYAWEPTAPTA